MGKITIKRIIRRRKSKRKKRNRCAGCGRFL